MMRAKLLMKKMKRMTGRYNEMKRFAYVIMVVKKHT